MSTLHCMLNSRAVLLTDNSLSDYINVNTLFIAVIVLAVLILIMLITYFASIKPNLNSGSSTKSANSNNTVDNVLAQIARKEEEELSNDNELVAVITAAIYASLGDAVPADGLVVRSIKRVNSKKWMNA